MNASDTQDVVVDSQDELLWRLRAFYGLKNAKGTKMLTIGGLEAYSRLAQENGPRVAKEVWGYEFINVIDEEFARRLDAARADQEVVRQIESQAAEKGLGQNHAKFPPCLFESWSGCERQNSIG